MADEMGTFRVDVEIENPGRPGERRTLTSVLVDTGAELSWFPAAALESLGIERYNKWRFRQADGTILERGPALRLSMSPANEPLTTSCSESPATWCCWAHTRWKGSTFGSTRSAGNWWTRDPRRPPWHSLREWR